MDVKGSAPEVLLELRQIGRELERALDGLYSAKNVLRNAVKGVDFESAMRRVAELEARLHALGAALFDQPCDQSSEILRLTQVYWCQIFLAATALSEWISRQHEELSGGAGLPFGRLQDLIERYYGAMKGAGKVWEKLYPQETEGTDS